MEHEVAGYGKSANSLSAQIQELERENEDLQRNLQASDEECNQLAAEKKKLEDSILELREQLRNAFAENIQAKSRISR